MRHTLILLPAFLLCLYANSANKPSPAAPPAPPAAAATTAPPAPAAGRYQIAVHPHAQGGPNVYVIDTATGRCRAHRVNGDTGKDEWDGMGSPEPAAK